MFVFGFDGRGLQRARIHLGQIVQLHVFDFTWCLGSAASSGDFGALFSHTNKSSVWDLPAELTSRMRRLMRNLNKMNATSNMSPAAAAMLPTAAPVRPIRPGLPGSSLGLFSGGTTGVPVLNFGSTVMLRSADVSPLPGIEMRNGSQSYALLAFAELVRETRYRPSGRFWKVS